MDKKKCSALVDGKECGLDLAAEETEEAKMLGLHRCAMGHRSYILASRGKLDPATAKSAPPPNESKK